MFLIRGFGCEVLGDRFIEEKVFLSLQILERGLEDQMGEVGGEIDSKRTVWQSTAGCRGLFFQSFSCILTLLVEKAH